MKLGLITKVSKFCNMRCSYCYETPELGNKATMSAESLEQLFRHIGDFVRKRRSSANRHYVEFIWHGGEPFAQPVSYWENILQLQRKILKDKLDVFLINGIQSNLTLVTKNHLALLRQFHLGFSYDVLNDLRVYRNGRRTDATVVKKLDWLLSEGIPLGGIAVVSRANVDHPQLVADFFLKRGLSFRALNLYQARDKLPQVAAEAVTPEEYMDFYTRLYRLPQVQTALSQGCHIDPLWYALRALRAWSQGRQLNVTDTFCVEKEWKLMINTNGDIYSPGDAYDPTYRYGNIFSDSFDEFLFESPGRRRRIERSRERTEAVCKNCFLFKKSCYGTFVSHATPEEYREFRRLNGCYHKLLAEMIKNDPRPPAIVSGAKQEILPAQTDLALAVDRKSKEVLYLNITYRCNSRCLFCAADVAYKEKTREMSLDHFIRILGEKSYSQIELSGGEPTIHPQFLEIVKLCRAHAEKVVLFSHGRTFQNWDFTEAMLQAGVTCVVIPLYGNTARTHDYVTKVKGSFDETIRGFYNLQSLRPRHQFTAELKFLLTRYTAPLNLAIYRFARQSFPEAFDRISIRPLIYSQSAIDVEREFSVPFSELKSDLVLLIEEIRSEKRYPLRLQAFPPCFLPVSLRSLAHPELNHSPRSHSRSYADDMTTGFSMDMDAVNFSNNVKGNVLIHSCRKCIHRDYCGDRVTPYFSSAYLQKFGETEFQPIPSQST